MLYNNLQSLDSLIQTTYQNYTTQLMSGPYLEELHNDKHSSKVKLKQNYIYGCLLL